MRCLSIKSAAVVVALLSSFCCLAADTVSAGPAAVPTPAPVPATNESPVVSGPLELLVGKLPLPFSYRIVSSSVGISTYLGLTANQDVELIPVDGPRAGKPMKVRVAYVAPSDVPSGFVQSAVNSESEKYATDARTRVVKPLRIGGFDFIVADIVTKFDGDERRIVRLMGTIGGNLVNIFILEDLEGEGPSPLVDTAAGLEVDYTATLRFRARLEAESKRTISGDRLLTPVGVLEEPRKVDAKLTSAFATYDGRGKLTGATQTYSFHKVGFWTVQSFAVTLGCNYGMPKDEEARRRLVDPFDADDEKLKRLSTTRSRIGGLEANKLELSLASRGGLRTLATRWYAEGEDSHYVIRIDRFNSRMQQLKLEEQLTAMEFRCQPESVIGVPPPVETPVKGSKAPETQG